MYVRVCISHIINIIISSLIFALHYDLPLLYNSFLDVYMEDEI